MVRFSRRTFFISGLLSIVAVTSVYGDETQIRFNRDIRPLLSDRCFACHGPDAGTREADLRLDDRESAVEFGAITPGEVDDSELLRRITSTDPDERMPPADSAKQPFTPTQVDMLRRWIRDGAHYEAHWSLTTPQRPDLPSLAEANGENQIDQFIARELEQHGLAMAPRADAVTLARRLHFDLWGMPPATDDVENFIADGRPDAYDRMVDRLLASPRFGERLAVYWLDLVRFANTVGYHGDQEHAIDPYRQYVVAALNANMPFDRFTIEQIAGDLLPDATVNQQIASGYNRLLQTSHEGGVQQKEYLAKYSADRVRNLGDVWMGVTMGCAECHDHKFDAYTQRDFYRLAAFFADVDDLQTFRGSNKVLTERKPEITVLTPTLRQRVAKLQDQLAASEASGNEARESAIREAIDRINQRAKRTMITVAIAPRATRVLERGDWMDESGEVVDPGVPDCLPPIQSEERRLNRLDLANWLVSEQHPQTARVFVNRLWYLFFGEGISRNLEDVGSQGQWPTHPELLDWLASEFMESGWDIKHVVRLIVTSSAYQQSSVVDAERLAQDPENRLFSRGHRGRLQAEFVRDTMLSISGMLVESQDDSSVRPAQPSGYYKHLNFPTRKYQSDTGANQYRRSVYMHWQRQYLHPMLKAFDAPSREECTAMRPQSNTPQAALTLLNDPSSVRAARSFAELVLRQPMADDAERIRWAWQRAVSRHPAPEEVQVLSELLKRHRAEYTADPDQARALLHVDASQDSLGPSDAELAAWTSVTRVILNLNETIMRN